MGPSAKNVNEVSTSLVVLDKELDKVAASTEKVKSGAVGSGQSLLQTGRVIQDFAQGGLGGILNNIEGLSIALGGGAGLAGVMTVLGVAALVAGPAIKSFFNSLIDGANDVPKSKDKIEQFTASLKANNEALDEMRKKQSLTNTELVEYNRLLSTNVQLEKELNAAKEQRQIIEKLAAMKPVGQEDRDRERAQNVQAEVGGNQAAITGEVARGMKDAESRGIAQEMNRLWPAGKAWGDLSPAAQQRYHELVQRQAAHQRGIPADLVAGAQEKVGRAAISGTETDLRDVLDYLPRSSRFRPGLEAATDAGMAQQDAADEEFQGQLDARSDAVKRRNANAKKLADANKKIDDLNKQGQEGAKIAFDEMDKAQEEGIKLGRQAGAAAAKLPRGIDTKGLDLGHLPMIPTDQMGNYNAEQAAKIMDENAQKAAYSGASVMQKLVENQGQLTAKQMQAFQQLKRMADQVGNALGQVDRSGGSNGFAQ